MIAISSRAFYTSQLMKEAQNFSSVAEGCLHVFEVVSLLFEKKDYFHCHLSD